MRASAGLKAKRKSIIRIKSTAEKSKEKAAVDYGNTPIEEKRLLAIWNTYAQEVKKQTGGFTGSILSNCIPKLQTDGCTILVTFKNATNEVEFNRLSIELLDHLKSQLKNSSISFETQVIVKEEKKVMFTVQEKYDLLTEKYPKLKDWTDKLDLEIK